jgi:phosphoribosylanthranilate isomerase
MALQVKICGLSTEEEVAAAVDGGARFVGFVFFPPSPRSVAPERLAELAASVPAGITKVALTVDADDDLLAAIVAGGHVDMLQLHGGEGPARVAEVKRRFGVAVMKAVSITGTDDVARARDFEASADRLLFDAKPPPGATRPGGNALAFDWEIVGARRWRLPWMLAGGLDAACLAEAVRISGAAAVDVSSGVEETPGVKSVAKIAAFLEAAARL